MEHKAAAGCVVLRRGAGGTEVLMIWTKAHPDPTLPKGGVEPGETLLACALRETWEETGYKVEAVRGEPVAVTARILDKHPPVVRKTIHWFWAQAVSGSPEDRLETSLISRVGWLSVDEALSRMLRPDEIEALRACLACERGGHRFS